jgi:hypothetical protein
MDYIVEILEKSFDYYIILMIILGNTFVWHLKFYPEWIINKKKSKAYLTALHSLIFGFIHYKLNIISGIEIDLKVMFNSFLLAISLYEFGLKEIIEWLRNNISKIVIKKIKKQTDDFDEPGEERPEIIKPKNEK